MPSACWIGPLQAPRSKTKSAGPPSAVQSRTASRMRLRFSDTQRARRRPWRMLSRRIAADGPAFSYAGPVTEEEALSRPGLPALSGQVLGVGSARTADGFELGVGEDAPGHEVRGEHWSVVARRGRSRGHRGRLDEARRVRARAGDSDARAVGVEDARGERARSRGLRWRPRPPEAGYPRTATSARHRAEAQPCAVVLRPPSGGRVQRPGPRREESPVAATREGRRGRAVRPGVLPRGVRREMRRGPRDFRLARSAEPWPGTTPRWAPARRVDGLAHRPGIAAGCRPSSLPRPALLDHRPLRPQSRWKRSRWTQIPERVSEREMRLMTPIRLVHLARTGNGR